MRICLLLAFNLLCALPLVAAPVTVFSSQIKIATVAEFNSILDQDLDVDSQLTTLNPLSASATSTATMGGENRQTFSSANATWTDTNQGSVTFGNTGSTNSTAGAGRYGFVQTSPSVHISGWEYIFVPQFDGTFDVAYDVDLLFQTGLNASQLAIQGFRLEIVGEPSILMEPGTSGSHTIDVFQGVLTTLRITPNGNLASANSTFNVGARVQGQFDWTITTVPEPSAALYLALPLLGCMTIRRKASCLR